MPPPPVEVLTRPSEDHQVGQAALVSLIPSVLQEAWPLLDVHDLQATAPQFTAAVEAVVRRYGRASASAALAYYAAERQAAATPGKAPTKLAPSPVDSVIESAVSWAMSDLYGPVTPQATADAADRLAESVTQLVLDQGRQTIIGAVRADKYAKGWARVTEPGACSFCVMLALRAGAGLLYYKKDSADFQAHDNCVIGSTLVNGPTTEIAYRRWYEGELVVVRTSSGNELSITPNHPVLTSRGWVEAGLLREGDDVVERAGADLASLGVPHEDDVPSRIEDVWGAHSVNGLRSVPVAAEDFHGDGAGTQGNVEVVSAHGFLAHMLDAEVGEFTAQPVGAAAGGSAVAGSLAAEGDSAAVLLALLHAAHGGMGGAGEVGTLCRAHAALANEHGVAAASRALTGLSEPSAHNGTSDTVGAGDGLDGLAGTVGVNDALGRGDSSRARPLGPGARYDPPALQDQAERLRVHADLGRALLERLTGGVQLSRVVDLRRVDYSGHVFNLQTAEGWYDASSVVVSNCRCHVEPVFTAYEPSARMREAQKVWAEATRGRSGADARLAFRQALDGKPVTGKSGAAKKKAPTLGKSGMTRAQAELQLHIVLGLKDSPYRTAEIARMNKLLAAK